MTPIIWQYNPQDRAWNAPGYNGMTLYWLTREWRNPPQAWKRGTFAMRYYPHTRTLAETLAWSPGNHERDLRGRL